jgi:hypothetical protein
MGYRSEVAYVIQFSTTQKRDEYINLVIASKNEDLITALQLCEVPIPLKEDDWQACRINFHASDVKWYDSYDEVKAHTRLYKWAEDLYPEDCGWHFIRIGEEFGDIQDETDENAVETPEDDFYPYTSMELPFEADYQPFDLDAFLTTPKEEA